MFKKFLIFLIIFINLDANDEFLLKHFKRPKDGEFIDLKHYKQPKKQQKIKYTKHYTRPKDGDFVVIDDFKSSSFEEKVVTAKSDMVVKNKKESKKSYRRKFSNIKPAKEEKIKITLKQSKPKEKQILKNVENTDLYQQKSLKDLLKIYEAQIAKNKKPNQKLYFAIKEKIAKIDSDRYDKFAILNALDDMQNQNMNKYEAKLTLDTMIKEIKQ